MPRLACFFVPLFTLAARLRAEPDLRDEMLAIVDGSGSHVHIVAPARRARRKGIHAGMSLAQARTIVPKLITRHRDAACEQTAQETLLEVAESFSPRLEDAGEGVVFADVTGMERHFEGEEALGKAAIRAMEGIGLPGRLGIAASKLAARVAAELPKSPVIVPAGSEETFLAPLPLARLSPQIEAASMLGRFGLTSIGELARLSESEIASRLGETGRALHRAARGIDPEPLIPRPLPPEFREAMELEWPLVALEPFLFVTSAALDRLSQRMLVQGFAAKRIELTMSLEPDGFDARGIDLPAPTRDVKTLLTLIRLDLERRPPGAPVTGFALTAIPDRPRRAQLSLFGPTAVSPEKLAATIARLVAMLGDGRVGMPVTVDGHAPERHALADFDPPPPPTTRATPPPGREVVAVRVVRPPVALDALPPIRRASAPWRMEEGWWRPDAMQREYFDVETEHDGVWRIYRDENGWRLDGRVGG